MNGQRKEPRRATGSSRQASLSALLPPADGSRLDAEPHLLDGCRRRADFSHLCDLPHKLIARPIALLFLLSSADPTTAVPGAVDGKACSSCRPELRETPPKMIAPSPGIGRDPRSLGLACECSCHGEKHSAFAACQTVGHNGELCSFARTALSYGRKLVTA